MKAVQEGPDKETPKSLLNIGAIFKALSQSLTASVAQKEVNIFTFVHDGNEFSFNIIESIHQNDSTAVEIVEMFQQKNVLSFPSGEFCTLKNCNGYHKFWGRSYEDWCHRWNTNRHGTQTHNRQKKNRRAYESIKLSNVSERSLARSLTMPLLMRSLTVQLQSKPSSLARRSKIKKNTDLTPVQLLQKLRDVSTESETSQRF